MDFLVIGAGLAGLTFARDMCDRTEASVRLLDKGRGVGGRMATRRMEGLPVDHGAQFFTARSERLKAAADAALAEGWLQIWAKTFPLWENGAITVRPEGHPRYALRDGMSVWAKRLAEGLDVRTGTTVIKLERSDSGKYLAQTQEGQLFHGDALILNLPPAQLLTLARPLLTPEMAAKITAATQNFLPAWTLLTRLESDIPGADWPAIEFSGHPVLGFVSRDHTKRGPDAPPVLVAHGAGDWSAAHIEDNSEDVKDALHNAVTEIFGPLTPLETQIHRWRYAQPTQSLSEKFLWDADARLGCIGDWCGGPRVEGAMESGWSLAGSLTPVKSPCSDY